MAKKPVVEEKVEGDDEPKTCFVIMPISDVDGYPTGHFAEVYNQLIEPAVTAANYKCSLATSTSASHMIQLDVVTKVATADLCICDLSTNNPNVLFEYGIRQAFDKPTVLIKDDKTRRIFDLSGFRDIEYDHTLRIANTLSTREAITMAIRDTVAGANDQEQVFSLVKLMKLTKAALPQGEISPDDARFTLLEKKLDNVLANLKSDRTSFQRIRSSANPHDVEVVRATFDADEWRALFFETSVMIADKDMKTGRHYTDWTQIQETNFYRSLSDSEKMTFRNLLLKFSSEVLPF